MEEENELDWNHRVLLRGVAAIPWGWCISGLKGQREECEVLPVHHIHHECSSLSYGVVRE
jgi:uncharacterized protein YbdZ (MbtH family)